MTRKIREYTRLTRPHGGFFSRATLWLGKDHILSVASNYYAEDYQRYYFSDMEALVVRKTPSGKYANITLFLFAAAMAGIGISFRVQAGVAGEAPYYTFLFLAIFPAFALLFNLFAGPTCEVSTLTSTGYHPLPAIYRIRQARQVIARISPEVEKAQGPMAVEEIRRQAVVLAKQPAPSPRPTRNHVPGPGEKEPYNGNLHRILFWFIIGSTALDPLFIHSRSLLTNLISSGLSIAVFAFIVTCLVRQAGRPLFPAGAKGATWTLLGVTISSNLFFFFYGIYLGVQFGIQQSLSKIGGPEDSLPPPAPFGPQFRVVDDPVMLGFFIAFSLLGVLISAWGLHSLDTVKKPGRR